MTEQLTRKQQLELWKQQKQAQKSQPAPKQPNTTKSTAVIQKSKSTAVLTDSSTAVKRTVTTGKVNVANKTNASIKPVVPAKKQSEITKPVQTKAIAVKRTSSTLQQQNSKTVTQQDTSNTDNNIVEKTKLLQQPAKRVKINNIQSTVENQVYTALHINKPTVQHSTQEHTETQKSTRTSKRNTVADISIDSNDSIIISPKPTQHTVQQSTASKISAIKQKLTQSALKQQQYMQISITQATPITNQLSTALSPDIDVDHVLRHIKTPLTNALDTSLVSPDMDTPNTGCLTVNESPISVNSPLVARKLVDVMCDDTDELGAIHTSLHSTHSNNSSFHAVQNTPYNDRIEYSSNILGSPVATVDETNYGTSTIFIPISENQYIIKSPNLTKKSNHKRNSSSNNSRRNSDRHSSSNDILRNAVVESVEPIISSTHNTVQSNDTNTFTSLMPASLQAHITRHTGIKGTAQRIKTPAAKHTQSQQHTQIADNVVYASIKAHKSDAEKLGHATFMSPVRRSTRIATEFNATQAVTNEIQLQSALEQNDYTYYPNNVLSSVKSGRKSRKSVKFNDDINNETDSTITNTIQTIDTIDHTDMIEAAVKTNKRKSSTSRKSTPAVKRSKQVFIDTDDTDDTVTNQPTQLQEEFTFAKPAPKQPRQRQQAANNRVSTPAARKSIRTHNNTPAVKKQNVDVQLNSPESVSSSSKRNKATPRPQSRRGRN